MNVGKKQPKTFEETVFATLLDALAIDYHCQVLFHDYWLEHYGIGRITVDFVVYRESHCAIFEIDGTNHRTWQQRRNDRMRDEFLKAQGFSIMRINNEELHADDLRPVASRVWNLIFGEG